MMHRIGLSCLGAAPACLWLTRVCALGERQMNLGDEPDPASHQSAVIRRNGRVVTDE